MNSHQRRVHQRKVEKLFPIGSKVKDNWSQYVYTVAQHGKGIIKLSNKYEFKWWYSNTKNLSIVKDSK